MSLAQMIYTTLDRIREHRPCEDGWKKLLKHLGKTQADDEPLPLAVILKSNGLSDALWCLRTIQGHDREIRLLAVQYARNVQHLMRDQRSITVINVAERFANGEATKEELAAAEAAARDAADAADAAWAAADAAWSAARDDERQKQTEQFLALVGRTEKWASHR